MKNILFLFMFLMLGTINAQTVQTVSEFKYSPRALPSALVESNVFLDVITNGEIYEYSVLNGTVTLFITIDGNKVHLLEEREKQNYEFLFEFTEYKEYPSVYSGYQENINATFNFYIGKYVCIKKDGIILWDRILEE